MLDDLRADVRQHRQFGAWYRKLGFWAVATYRLGAWMDRRPNRLTRLLGLGLHSALSAPLWLLKDVHLPASARIGPGLVILHPHDIFVPPGVRIGRNCLLLHGVTLGRGPIAGFPTLGDDVSVHVGAKVLGGVTVGDGAEIGANAVVIRDVPAGSIVAAPASRAIPRETVRIVASPAARARAQGAGTG